MGGDSAVILSDQILAIAKDMHTHGRAQQWLIAAQLRLIAAQVSRMEATLDEIVEEAREEARAPVVVHFPPHFRRR
jgi:hypothetical protein